MTATFFQYADLLGRPGLAFLYLALQLFVGSFLPFHPRAKPFLFWFFERISLALAAKLNRKNRSSFALALRGVLFVLFVGGVVYALSHLLHRAEVFVPAGLTEILALALCLGFWVPYRLIKNATRLLPEKKYADVAKTILPYVRAPLEKPDEHVLGRRLLEILIRQQLAFVVAPLFWFLLAGVEGVILCVAVAGMYGAVNVSEDKSFAGALRMLHLFLNIGPAFVLCGLIVAGSAFVSGGRVLRAIVMACRGAIFSPFYLGALLSAFAGGLGVVLGGPHCVESQGKWIGHEKDSAKIVAKDLWRGLLLYFISFLLILGGLLAFIIVHNKT